MRLSTVGDCSVVVHLAMTRTVIGWRSLSSTSQSSLSISMPSDDQKLIFKYLSFCNSLAAIGMVGVIVKVIISREHSLTFSRLGETWRFQKNHSWFLLILLRKVSFRITACVIFDCGPLFIFEQWQKRTPLNSNGQHAFIRELQKYPIQFLDKSVYTFLIKFNFWKRFFQNL